MAVAAAQKNREMFAMKKSYSVEVSGYWIDNTFLNRENKIWIMTEAWQTSNSTPIAIIKNFSSLLSKTRKAKGNLLFSATLSIKVRCSYSIFLFVSNPESEKNKISIYFGLLCWIRSSTPHAWIKTNNRLPVMCCTITSALARLTCSAPTKGHCKSTCCHQQTQLYSHKTNKQTFRSISIDTWHTSQLNE